MDWFVEIYVKWSHRGNSYTLINRIYKDAYLQLQGIHCPVGTFPDLSEVMDFINTCTPNKELQGSKEVGIYALGHYHPDMKKPFVIHKYFGISNFDIYDNFPLFTPEDWWLKIFGSYENAMDKSY